MPKKHYWWSDLPGERYWCEITDRENPGDDLLCPQKQEGGKAYWSYNLILQIRPGDVIFHYYTPSKAFVGASVAAGLAAPDKMTWVAHGTVGRRKGQESVLRPAWRLPLRGFVAASRPLTLLDVQEDEAWVRSWIAGKKDVADVVAAPFQPYPGRLRGYQGYLTKMPLAFVNRWPSLKELADQLCATSYVRELFIELKDNEAVLAALMNDVRQFHSQGFQVSPKVRRAVESYAIERAKQYYQAQGYVVQLRGKPYDLHCTKQGSILHVEVKGTTTTGEEILLTPNEVDFANKHALLMALFIVSHIQVTEGDDPVVAGGKDTEIRPWVIDSTHLSPIAYSYRVDPSNI